MVGSRLVLAEPGGHRDSRYLVDLIIDAGVTTVHFVPSMLTAFLEERAADDGQIVAVRSGSGEVFQRRRIWVSRSRRWLTAEPGMGQPKPPST